MPSQFQHNATTAVSSPTIPVGTRKVSIQNRGTANVYVGVTDQVSATTGHVLLPGDVWIDEAISLVNTTTYPVKPYVLAASGSQALSVICL